MNQMPVTVGGCSLETVAETASNGVGRKSAVDYDIQKGSEVKINVQILDESPAEELVKVSSVNKLNDQPNLQPEEPTNE